MSLVGKTVIWTGFIPGTQQVHFDNHMLWFHLVNYFERMLVVEIRAVERWETTPSLFGIFRRKVK